MHYPRKRMLILLQKIVVPLIAVIIPPMFKTVFINETVLEYALNVYCIIKVPKVAETIPQSCMRNFPIIADAVWYFPKPIYRM